MKKRGLLLILITILMTLVLIYLWRHRLDLRTHYSQWCSHYEVWGEVVDLGTGSTVEGALVSGGDLHTFSGWDGTYFLKPLSFKDSFSLELPEGYEATSIPPLNYETYLQRLTCQRVLSRRDVLIPGSTLVVDRLLEAEIRRNYDYLWALMTKEGQTLWGSRKLTNVTMKERDRISDKYGTTLASFEVLSGPADVGSWVYPLTGNIYTDVAGYEVSKVSKDGNRWQETWYLVKEDGYWHYFPPQSRAQVERGLPLP